MPEGGGGESAAAPEVASDDDDDGDSDGEPARPRRARSSSHQPITPALLSFDQLSQYVCLNRTRIYAAIRAGTFPPQIKIGKSSRWHKAAVDDWITAQVRLNTLAAR